ncbi:MAG: hypothetical protein RL427_176 [Bacteroidota bacterium]
MKKIVLVSMITLWLVSCNHKEADFKGLEPLLLGQDFTALKNKAAFRKVMDDEYFAETFDVKHGVGTLYKVNVTTVKGKISEVRFSNGKGTNSDALKTIMSHLIPVDLGPKTTKLIAAQQQLEFKVYTSRNKKINFFVSAFKNPHFNKKSVQHEYQYLSAEPKNEK